MKSARIGLVLLLLLSGFLWVHAHRQPFVLPSFYKQVLEEVSSVDVWIGSLTPDPQGKTLAFSSGTKAGRKLVLLDLQTLQKNEVPTTNEVTFIFGWSPDGRYLAFDQVPYQPEKLHKTTPVFFESWLTLYDRKTGSIQRLTENTNVMETPFFWLPGGGYLLCSRNLTNDYGVMYAGGLAEKATKPISAFMPDIAIVSDTKLVYALKSDLYLLDIRPLAKAENRGDLTNTTTQKISNFKTNGFNGSVWVRYNPGKSNFLFCARPSNSEWRHLYQFEPTHQMLTQLSREDTYNGQLLCNGNGFAYVINTNDAFQLAIRAENPVDNTNLFENGNVVIYKTSPDGDKVYASAAIQTEPHGIWEYTVTNHVLRKLSDGVDTLVATRIINPSEYHLKSFDGLDLPCFLFSPRNDFLESNSRLSHLLEPQKKYPLVLYVPPVTSQFQRRFDAQSQLFANCGFYYATVNYRGCDGYGARYSALYDSTNACKDVLTFYDDLVARHSDIDRNRIFLATSSAGIWIVSELLAARPGLWRAIGLDKCPPPDFEKIGIAKLPPIITIIGTLDPAFERVASLFGGRQMALRG